MMDARERKEIDSLNTDWTEFKGLLDQRVQALEKGQGTAEIQERMDRIQAAMAESEKVLAAIRDDQQQRVDDLHDRIEQMGTGLVSAPPDTSHIEGHAKLGTIYAMNGRSMPTLSPADASAQYAEYKDALRHYLRTKEVRAALTIGSDPSGGYLVDPDMSGRMVDLIRETSPMRRLAHAQMITTDRLTGPIDIGEAGAGWVGETDARPETDTPDLGMWELPVHTMYAMPKASETLLMDASEIDGWLTRKVAERFGRLENSAFVNGNGKGKPRGFLSYPRKTTNKFSEDDWGSLEFLASGSTSSTAALSGPDKLIQMRTRLKDRYLMRAAWVMNRATLALVMTLSLDDSLGTVFVPDYSRAPYGMILGHPVYIFDDMPNLGTSSASIAFGDFMSGYQIVDRLDIRILRDPYFQKPHVLFYTIRRLGGGVIDFDAIKVFQHQA